MARINVLPKEIADLIAAGEVVERPSSVIKEFVEKMSDGSMSCEEQSLYRNLRKFQHLEIVGYDSKRVSKGPDRKYYYLTDIGMELFKRFVERNILIFTKESINNLLNK